MMVTTTFCLFMIACVKGILDLGPFPKGQMLTWVDGYSMEANNYMHLETVLLATVLFSSWQGSQHCQCYHSGLLKHSGFVLKRNKITFKKLFLIMAYLSCRAGCCAIHFTFHTDFFNYCRLVSLHSLKIMSFYLICDRFHVNFTGIWFCLSMEHKTCHIMSKDSLRPELYKSQSLHSLFRIRI